MFYNTTHDEYFTESRFESTRCFGASPFQRAGHAFSGIRSGHQGHTEGGGWGKSLQCSYAQPYDPAQDKQRGESIKPHLYFTSIHLLPNGIHAARIADLFWLCTGARSASCFL